jgi:hypothetical protein
MGFYRGPRIVTNGLVMYLDAANIKSFKGEPTTNLLTNITYPSGNQNTTYFKSNFGTETVTIPSINGLVTSYYVNIYNDFIGGSTNGYPQLFGFGNFTVSPSTTYTYQIIFRTGTGYSHPNYMYHYQYNGGTYVTEDGLLDAGRIQDLGNGWKHAWGTFTTEPGTNYLQTYLFHYEYATQNKVQVAGVMLTQGNIIYPPQFFLPVGGTRGTTVATGGGWKDLSNNSNNGELVNIPKFSANYKGGITFDGSDDYINCGNKTTAQFTHTSAWSFSFFGMVVSQNTTYPGFIKKGNSALSGILVFYANLSGTTYIILKHNNNQPVNVTIQVGVPFHYTVTHNGTGTTRVYKNGVYVANGPTIVSTETTNDLLLGTADAYGNVTMYNFMKYNIRLTDSQVLENFNSLKSKFSL